MVAAIRACCPSRQMLAVAVTVAVSDSDSEGVLRRTLGEPTAAEKPGRIAATKNKRFNFVKDTFNMIEYDKFLPEYLGQNLSPERPHVQGCRLYGGKANAYTYGISVLIYFC
jgi:hypothetical protein